MRSGAAAARRSGAGTAQTTAQRLFGDVNPKLAELTDGVLFGDVWARPGLSPRDRSLVTVSALITMNRGTARHRDPRQHPLSHVRPEQRRRCKSHGGLAAAEATRPVAPPAGVG
jgi:hypothetical protein